MNKQFFLFIGFYLFVQIALASPKSERIDAMLFRAFELLNSNNDSAKIYALQALKLSQQINYKKGQAGAYMRLGVVMSNSGKIDSALYFLRNAATLRTQINDIKGAAGAYREISYIYKSTKNFDSAFSYCLSALRMNESLNDKSITGINSNDVGALYLEYGNFKEAKKYFESALKLVVASGDSTYLGLVYNSIGEYYFAMANFEAAKLNFSKALNINTYLENNFAANQNKTNIAACFLELKQFEKSKQYYQNALTYYFSNKIELELAIVYQALGELSLHLNQNDSALYFINKSIEVASKAGYIEIEALSYKTLAKVFETKGNYNEALKAQRKFELLNDSNLNNEKVRQIAEMQTKYETERKDKAIVILNKENEIKSAENKRQLLILWGTIILLITIVGFLVLVFHQKRNITKEKLRSDQLVLDKEMLIKEIHHRVKNNLEVISSLLELQSEGIIDDVAKAAVIEGQNRVQAIALIHHQLYKTDDVATVEFKSFVNELYKQIAAVFAKPNAEINFEVNAIEMQLSIDAAVPLGLVLNELLTNTFKYAISNKHQNKISIQLIPASEAGLNKVIFSDNGPGLPENLNVEKSLTLGMKVIHLLTRQLGGKLNYYNNNGSVFEIPFKMIK
jgi:two-component sensor histidine kinase/tetratricopeptide (TPR) repeat protein